MRINRRDFLKSCAALGAGGLLLSNKALDVRRLQRKPNIVFIFIDDMGWTGTGFNGSGYYETPNTDVLASEGMIFTNAYTCAANCAPTRATLMSGQYGPRTGVYTVGSGARGDSVDRRLIPTTNITNLPKEIVTVADSLGGAGYVTACIGKWHLGNSAEYSPDARGFDYVIANSNIPGNPTVDPKRASAFSDHCITFMEANKDKPFFLYMSHHAVHTPNESTPELTAKYEAKPEWHGQNHAVYGGMTEHTDTGIGRVLDKIDELGIRDNTLVIFYCDNGGAGQQTSNWPLRGYKGMFYEGGIRVPMCARWPGIIRPGTKCDEPVITVDFYPTFMELAKGKRPDSQPLDGVSIIPLFNGAKSLNRYALYWHFPGYLQGGYEGSRDPIFRTRPVGTIRKGKWKLLQYFEEWVLDGGGAAIDTNNSIELYDLENDMSETTNLALTNKAKRDELLADLQAWQASVNAPIPTEYNTEYTG